MNRVWVLRLCFAIWDLRSRTIITLVIVTYNKFLTINFVFLHQNFSSSVKFISPSLQSRTTFCLDCVRCPSISLEGGEKRFSSWFTFWPHQQKKKRARSNTKHIYLSSKSGPASICWLRCYSLEMTDAIIHLCLAINEKNGLSRVGWGCWGSASTFYTWVSHTPQVKWMMLSGFMRGGNDELLGQVAIIGSSLETLLVKH